MCCHQCYRYFALALLATIEFKIIIFITQELQLIKFENYRMTEGGKGREK